MQPGNKTNNPGTLTRVDGSGKINPPKRVSTVFLKFDSNPNVSGALFFDMQNVNGLSEMNTLHAGNGKS